MRRNSLNPCVFGILLLCGAIQGLWGCANTNATTRTTSTGSAPEESALARMG